MKGLLHCRCSDKCQRVAPLLLRLAVGSIFIAHGYQKLAMIGVENFGNFLGSMGVPAAGLFAWFITILEIGGGAALILGIAVHWISKLFAAEMLTAFFLVHITNGIFVEDGGFELVMLLFAAVVSLIITGAGKWSLDDMMMKKKKARSRNQAPASSQPQQPSAPRPPGQ